MKKTLSIIILLLVFSCGKKESNHQEKHNPKITKRGFDFIKKAEGCKLYAYDDGARWTIGYGNTYYPNGTRVKKGDKITQETANELFLIVVHDFAKKTLRKVHSNINSSNLEALTSYTYNRGLRSFERSNLLIKVNHDPTSKEIREAFINEWGSNTRYKYSLIKRRIKESELYYQDNEETI